MPVHVSPLDLSVFEKYVNGWLYNPASNRNGIIWYGIDAERSVGVFSTVGDEVRVTVFDDRVRGFKNNIEPYRRTISEDEEVENVIEWAIQKAQRWMRQTAPTEWDHPDIVEPALTPPPGYVLDKYYLEAREHIIYYRREGAPSGTSFSLNRPGEDVEPSPNTFPYLHIKTWRGSGNSTIALAPWLRAMDDELHEIVDPPEKCGLEIAHKLLLEYIEDETGASPDTAVGQADLGAWTT